MKPAILLCLVVAVYGIHDKDIDVPTYDGYKVFRVYPTSQKTALSLRDLQMSGQFDFWTEPRLDRPTDIMAPAHSVPDLDLWLREHGIPHTVLIQNVQELIEKEKVPAAEYNLARSSRYDLTWDRYHRLDDFNSFMDALAASYPDLVTVKTIGSSYEGRPIKVVKVSTGGFNKPGIFIDGGIHAREWISPATVSYMLRELVENNPQYSDLINKVDWYFMPVINPDGYEYTHTNARMWRKTRSDHDSFWGCVGVDANRNWDFHWSEGGVSFDKCSDIYCGPKPFSEVEMKIISDFIKAKKNIRLYASFHAFSQLWLSPWGYTTAYPADYVDLYSFGTKAAAALRSVHGTEFTVGTSSNVLYPAAGGSDDWAKGVCGIKYSYTVELRDTGYYGFILPPDQIVPSGQETFAAIKAAAEEIIRIYA